MKKFLLKIALFTIVIATIILGLLYKYSGYVDYFYGKVSSPQQKSLIIGDSRSFQGIQPKVIEASLGTSYQLPILNFSFTIKQMAYGDAWLKTIKKKVNPETKNGLFILSVHPWVLSEREEDDPANGVFYEEQLPPNNLHFVNLKPNVEYFFKNYEYFHFKAMIKKISNVHEDGWLEENNIATDSATLNKWRKTQLNLYSGFAKKWKKSNYRLEKLKQIISFLQSHGKVVLVRMPVAKEILNFESNIWSDFDKDMIRISKSHSVSYFSFSEDNEYFLYDGIHLNKEEGKKFTQSLCDSIKSK